LLKKLYASICHQELRNAIVFIASDEASFITGHILNVDGGGDARTSVRPLTPGPLTEGI
jgi:hypothetical protein